MLDAYRRWLALCSYCPTLCLYACPVSNAEGRTTVSPCSKMTLARWVLEGHVPLDADAARVFFECLGCLACRVPCRHEVEVGRVLLAARAAATAAGVNPFPRDRFAAPADDDAETRLRAAVPARYFVPEAQVLLFAGCDVLRSAPQLAAETLEVASALGVDFLGVGPASALCCGYPLYAAGYLDDFRRVADDVRRALQPYRRVVALDPCCAYTLRALYAEVGVPLGTPVEHVTEFLAPRVAGAPLKALPGAASYHDPCYLGRYLSVYAAPRQILARVLSAPLVELPRSGVEAPCCGGGAVFDRTNPAVATRVAGALVADARAAGASQLVTACSRCLQQFRAVAGEIPVAHIVTLLHRALGLTKEAP